MIKEPSVHGLKLRGVFCEEEKTIVEIRDLGRWDQFLTQRACLLFSSIVQGSSISPFVSWIQETSWELCGVQLVSFYYSFL